MSRSSPAHSLETEVPAIRHAVTPRSADGHVPELDGVRAIAVLAVFALHFTASFGIPGTGIGSQLIQVACRGGWVGVDLFFVLSGFLITGILLDKRGSRHYYRNFYVRRVLRIAPPFYFSIVLVALTVGWSAYLSLSVVFLSNFGALLGISMTYPYYWSLAVEEHFYFLWPFLTRRLSLRRLEWLAVALLIFCPACRAISYLRGYTPEMLSFFRFDTLAMGALIAIRVRKRETTPAELRALAGRVFLAATAISAVGIPLGVHTRTRALGAIAQYTVIGFFMTSCMLYVLGSKGGRLSAILRSWPFQRIGAVSYGLYLYHPLAITATAYFAKTNGIGWLGSLALASTLGIGFSQLSLSLMERPILRLKQRF